jgi:hypothetical protein
MTNTEARAARDAGIATAAAHADRIDPTWRQRAYDALVAYASRHRDGFTIEQVRQSLGAELELPPSLRAWGAIALRAQREGIIERAGFTEATDPKVHLNLVTLWRLRDPNRPRDLLRAPIVADPAVHEAKEAQRGLDYLERAIYDGWPVDVSSANGVVCLTVGRAAYRAPTLARALALALAEEAA